MKFKDSTAETNESHKHCIEVLKQCHSLLSQWYNTSVAPLLLPPDADISSNSTSSSSSSGGGGGDTAEKSVIFNRFVPLSEEDLSELSDLMHEGDAHIVQPSSEEQASSGGDKRRSQLEIDLDHMDDVIGEIKIATICFMMDLIKVIENITTMWEKVRSEEIPKLSATAATVVALRMIDKIYAQLQLQFPSIKVASDFLLRIAGKSVSAAELGKCHASSLYDDLILHYNIFCHFRDFLLRPHLKRGKDKEEACSIKMHYDRHFGANPAKNPVLVESLQVLPMSEPCIKNFFYAELATLYNTHACYYDELSDRLKNFPSMGVFLKDFLQFFENQTISLPLLLRSLCWMKIVNILQSKDNLTLGRTIYLARKDSRRAMDLYSFETPVLDDLRNHMTSLGLDVINEVHSKSNIVVEHYLQFHFNPLLAGCHALDLCSMSSSEGMFFNASQIIHCYSALRSEGFIATPIPFLDTLIEMFHKYIFPGLPGTAHFPTKGKYVSSSCIKGNFTIEAVSLSSHLQASSKFSRSPGFLRKKNTSKKFWDSITLLKPLLKEDDASSIIFDSEMSIDSVLKTVEKLATDELYISRKSSVNATRLMRLFNSFILRLFNKQPDILTAEQRQKHAASNSKSKGLAKKMGRSTGALGATEGVVARTQTALLIQDVILSLTIGPTSRFGILRALDANQTTEGAMGQGMMDFCKLVGSEMTAFFSKVDFDNDLCHLPRHCIKREEEFGIFSPKLMVINPGNPFQQMAFQLQNQQRQSFLIEIETINRMAQGREKTAKKQKFIAEFKDIVRIAPQLLQIVDDHLDFPSLLDHVASGQFADMDLAEWIIQMKGLGIRGLNLMRMSTSTTGVNRSKSHLTLACLAKIDKEFPHDTWAVQLMMAATQFLDFAFCARDDPSGNTALHYVCQAGNTELYMMLHNNQYKTPNVKGQPPECCFRAHIIKKFGLDTSKFKIVPFTEAEERMKNHYDSSGIYADARATVDQRTATVNKQLLRDTSVNPATKKKAVAASAVSARGSGVPKQEEALASCACCSQVEAALNSHKKCSQCRAIKYCSVECQKAHWKEHKLVCKK